MKHVCFRLLLATGLFAAGLSASVQAAAVNVLFVGGGPSSAYAGADGNVLAFLQEKFYYADIDYVQASAATTASANGYDLVVISSTPDSGSIRSKWTNISAGILNWEQAVADDDGGEFMMADSLTPINPGPVALDLTNTSHPITTGFSAGTVNLTTGANGGIYYSQTLGSGVVAMGSQVDAPGNSLILAADKGAVLRGGSLSPNRRVMFAMDDNTFNVLTPEARQLFAQSALWAGDLRPVLAEFTFPTLHGGETGAGYSPTAVASLLDSSVNMAIRDTAGKIAMEISDPVAGSNHYASQPVLRVGPANGATSLELAVAMDSYFEFTLAPSDGGSIDLAALEFDAARGGGTTPRGWGLYSSVDGFADAIAWADLLTERPNFTHFAINLNQAPFQDLTEAITFRIYVYSPASGATIEFDNFELLGRVSVPEPASLGLLIWAAGGLAVIASRRRRTGGC